MEYFDWTTAKYLASQDGVRLSCEYKGAVWRLVSVPPGKFTKYPDFPAYAHMLRRVTKKKLVKWHIPIIGKVYYLTSEDESDTELA